MSGDLVDLHAHVLPGVDDGPPDVEAAVALARGMVDAGVRTVVATSHVSGAYPNRPATLAAARATLQEALAGAGVALEILPGAEVALEEAARLDDATLGALTLGGGPYLLAEAPLSPAVGDVEPAMTALLDRGFRLVVAHPERSPAFQRSPDQLARLVAQGALCAITAGALAGRFGRTAAHAARRLLADGLAHVVTSDAHDLAGRPPGLLAELEAGRRRLRGLDEVTPWLVRDMPRAILEGAPPPPPPALVEELPAPRRRPLRRLLGRF